MSDKVRIVHPNHPGHVAEVTRGAYERRSKGLGWVLADEAPAIEPDMVVAVPSEDDLNAKLDEKDQLRRQLEDNGIEVDGRWGLKRLRTEVANLADVEPICSICGAPAVYEIEGTPKEKGNLACGQHRSMWPLSEARPLSSGTP